jgi:SAM-dependent methyltransferase
VTPGTGTSGGYDPKLYWTERGRTYKREFHERFERRRRESGADRNLSLISRTLADAPFESFLDIGCGYGLYLDHVEKASPGLRRIAGCDISPTQLAEARRFLGSGSRVELAEVDGETLPYEDEAFDVTFTYGVCIHVPHPRIEAFLGEILRVTRRSYIFIESSVEAAAQKHPHYFAHDYPAILSRLGYRTELLADLDPDAAECLRRVTRP